MSCVPTSHGSVPGIGGPEILPREARFTASPIPLVMVVSAGRGASLILGVVAVRTELMAAAWASHLAVAEWTIRRPTVRGAKRTSQPRTALVGSA